MQMCSSTSKSLHHPLLLTKRASIVLLYPQLHTAIVEGMVALAPHNYRRKEKKSRKYQLPVDIILCVLTVESEPLYICNGEVREGIPFSAHLINFGN